MWDYIKYSLELNFSLTLLFFSVSSGIFWIIFVALYYTSITSWLSQLYLHPSSILSPHHRCPPHFWLLFYKMGDGVICFHWHPLGFPLFPYQACPILECSSSNKCLYPLFMASLPPWSFHLQFSVVSQI